MIEYEFPASGVYPEVIVYLRQELNDMLGELGLYIHIPFCKKKCFYCDFNSYQRKEYLVDSYFRSLNREAELLLKDLEHEEFTTVFIGGGTPSYVDESYISGILAECRKRFNLSKAGEVSIETNPGTLDYGKLKAYREAGVNRLSIGLQACQDKLLSKLGRIHNFTQFKEGYRLAREAGFENINIDLIFGLPGQTITEWEETLNIVTSLRPEHVSCYSLKIEEGTRFYDLYGSEAKVNELPQEDEEREMYRKSISILKESGYKHYEISNFSLPGYECRQNLIYWRCEPYIGMGAGAHSYYGNSRFCNETSLEGYIKEVNLERLPRRDIQKIDKKESMSEYIILGLRLIDGVKKNGFSEKYGMYLEDIYNTEINKLTEAGLIQSDHEGIRLTDRGLNFANIVMSEFLSFS